MAREIKFRAWNIYKEEMIELGGLDSIFITDRDLDFANYEIMQFTGLLDKNGVEFYEGDIVQSKNNHKFVIDYKYGSFGATWLKDDSVWYSCATCCFEEREFIVIGNIYEHEYLLNPELLEGK